MNICNSSVLQQIIIKSKVTCKKMTLSEDQSEFHSLIERLWPLKWIIVTTACSLAVAYHCRCIVLSMLIINHSYLKKSQKKGQRNSRSANCVRQCGHISIQTYIHSSVRNSRATNGPAVCVVCKRHDVDSADNVGRHANSITIYNSELMSYRQRIFSGIIRERWEVLVLW